MQINLGNFGNAVAAPQRDAYVSPDNAVSNALQNVASVGMKIASEQIDKQRQLDDDLSKTRAYLASQDYDLQTKTVLEKSKQRLQAGEIDRLGFVAEVNDARQKAFKETVGALPSDLHAENALRVVAHLDKSFALQSATVVEQDQQRELAANAFAVLDKAGKLVGLPGTDVEKVNQQFGDAYLHLAAQANIPQDRAQKTVQDWRDTNWTNQATQRAMEAKDDLGKIQHLEHDLTNADGFYAQKLDTDKRNAILRTVVNDRLRIENRMQNDVDRREAKAEKTITEIDRQISSGVPMTADSVLAWSAKVKGTSFEPAFQQRMQDEAQVQQVLRLPIDQQTAFVQAKEAELLNGGGSVVDKANIDRLKTMVGRNTQQLQSDPLVFAQNRLGRTVAPLDMQDVLQNGAAGKLGEQMSERVATISALQKQYGTQVQMHPLLPQEANFFVKALDQASPKQQSQLFGVFRAAINDDTAYGATMQQIAHDSPVKAVAGAIAAKQRGITLERKWFGTDNVASSTDVAETLLVGESIVNKTKGQKAEDGLAKSLYLPPRNAFNAAFATVAGDLYRNGRSTAQETDLQAAYAYYVGRSAQSGRLNSSPTDIDDALVKESLAATVGEPINFHGRGMVTAPWGMSTEGFKANIESAFVRAVRENGLPESTAYQFENYGLMAYRGGTYVPTIGGLPVLNPKTGKPLALSTGDSPINPGMKVPQ